MKIVTRRNYEPYAGSINELPSLTVPDLSLSMREILQRFTRGQAIPAGVVREDAVYLGEQETLDFERMDKQDLIEYSKELAEEAKEARSRMKKRADDFKEEEEKKKKKSKKQDAPEIIEDDLMDNE